MPGFVKPSWPVWQSGKAPAGCKLYLPLAEGAGTTVRDYAGGLNGSFAGTPTWQRGLYGPQLGGFSTSNYVAIDPPVQVIGSVYPGWIAILAANTATTNSVDAICQGSSLSNNPVASISYNFNGTNNLGYFVRGSAGGADGAIAPGITAQNDGQPHVAMAVSYSVSDHRLYFDGRQVATYAGNLGAMSCDRLTLGTRRRTTVSNAFAGSLLWAGAGNGSVPDPLSFASDLLSGRFSAVRRQSNLALWAALAPTPVAPAGSPAAIMMGF